MSTDNFTTDKISTYEIIANTVGFDREDYFVIAMETAHNMALDPDLMQKRFGKKHFETVSLRMDVWAGDETLTNFTKRYARDSIAVKCDFVFLTVFILKVTTLGGEKEYILKTSEHDYEGEIY